MAKVRSWVGLDVHAAKVVACVVDAESGEMTVHRLSGETAEVVAFCCGLPAADACGLRGWPNRLWAGAGAGGGAGRVCGRGAGQDRAPRAGQDQDRRARRRAAGAVVDDRRAARGQGADARAGSAARSGPRA